MEIEKQIEYPKKGIMTKVIQKNKRVEITLFCMAKGSSLGEHTSTKIGDVFVIEGKGIFRLKGKNIKMKKNTYIHMNKNEVHSLRAEKNTSFLLWLY